MEVLVLMEATKYRLVRLNGETLSTEDLSSDGRQITATKSYVIKDSSFVLVEHDSILIGEI